MVRHHFPQVGNHTIDTNTNFPPQSVSSSNWFDRNFKRRVLITINANQVPSTQTDFPFLFNSTLTDLTIDHVQSGGEDIRFASEDGQTEFDVEIEKMDIGTTTLQAWTKVPSITNGTQFYMYYNNPNASFPPLANIQAVWTSDYKAVYHLNQTDVVSADSTKDSTVNQNDGSPLNSPTQLQGQIDGSLNFNGTNEFVLVPDSSELDPGTGSWSVSAWVNPDNLIRMDMVGKQNLVDFKGWTFRLSQTTGSGRISLLLRDGGTLFVESDGLTVISTGSYCHVVATYDGSKNPIGLNLFIDGIKQGKNTIVNDLTAPIFTATELNIGDQGGATASNLIWDGKIDEVHISNIEKTPDFIKTEFNNQNDPDTPTVGFYKVGMVETIP